MLFHTLYLHVAMSSIHIYRYYFLDDETYSIFMAAGGHGEEEKPEVD